MNPPLAHLANPIGIANANALVVAGNRQILGHALAALEQFNVPTETAILVVSSATSAYREAVLASAAVHRWAVVFCALAPSPTSRPQRHCWKAWSPPFIRHLHDLNRCTHFLEQVAQLRATPLRFVVSGFYGHPIDRTACCLIPHEEFVLVDDGNMTREVARQRGDERAAGFRDALRHNSTLDYSDVAGRVKLFLSKRVGGVRDDGSPRITYFTHYHDLVLSGEDRLIRYAPVRRSAEVSVLPNTVHFLGMPALKKKIVAPASFARLLEAAEKRYRGAVLHYYGHPSEGAAEFQLVRQCIPNVQIHGNKAPYEQEYLQMASVPAVVAAFYSSTLFNMAAQPDLQSRLELLEIPARWILSPARRERVGSIYQDAERHPKIQLIPFPLNGQCADETGSC